MKLKEVCTETGLSRKTIRLYEEKGLLIPQMERRNERDYREYTQEDISKLKTIAMLRRAWFTMDEIKQMFEHPETIQEIFPQYVEWLKNQKQELDTLISVAETISVSNFTTVEVLTEQMAVAARNLPLPQYDITPRFKHLDAIEEATYMENKKEKDLYEGVENTKKAYRQTALMMDQDKINNHAITFGQIRELKTGDYSPEGPVKKEVTEAPLVKAITKIGWIIFILGFLLFAIMELAAFMGLSSNGTTMNPAAIWAVVAMVIGIALYGCAHGYSVYQERQRWLKVVREQDEEKKKDRG